MLRRIFIPYDGGSTTLLSLLPPTLAGIPAAVLCVGMRVLRACGKELYREHPGWDNMVHLHRMGAHPHQFGGGSGIRTVSGENFVRAAQMHGCGDPADLDGGSGLPGRAVKWASSC
ncbi:MAG: hypothetical protein ACLVEX_04025 [Ruthenibacterium lactatiformans]